MTVEHRLKPVYGKVPVGIFHSDSNGTFLAGHFDARKLPFPREDFTGKRFQDILPPHLSRRMEGAFCLALASNSVQFEQFEVQVGGRARAYDVWVISSRTGTVFTVVHAERPRAGEGETNAGTMLREAEERYRDLFLNTPDCVFWVSVSPGGEMVVDCVNPACASALASTADKLHGRKLEDLKPFRHSHALGSFRRCIETNRTIDFEERSVIDNKTRYFQTLLVPISDREGRVYRMVCFSRDITEMRQAEEAVQQAQKLESLGVLAGGIAHDFNNLLTAILCNLNLAQLNLSGDSPARPYLDNMEKVALKAAELAKQMLAYSGRGQFVVKKHDLNMLVQELTRLLQVSISKRITLRFFLQPGLPPFEADAAQIQQVVMNLVTNASDAIGDRNGTITITTGRRAIAEAEIAASFTGQPLSPGDFLVLDVTDTGCGMPEEVIARIFDPFFTTKTAGHGLGLSAMQGILRGHGAGISISSQPGMGSSFQLYFPVSPDCEYGTETTPAAESKRRFDGLVLLVDDEPSILACTGAALQSMGFDVVTARDGEEAVALFGEHKDRLSLVILDLTMPNMDGRQACEIIHRERPDLSIILSSGYDGQDTIRSFSELNLAGFLQKPYLLSDLRSIVGTAVSRESLGRLGSMN